MPTSPNSLRASIVRSAITYVLVSAAWALLLAALLLSANRGPFGIGAVVELLVATLVVCLVLNAVFFLVLAGLWPAFRFTAPRWFAGNWIWYLLSGLMSFNLTWVLWNRLAMVHQWLSVRPFMNWAGLIQSLMLALFFASIIVAAVRMRAGRSGLMVSGLAAVVAVTSALAMLSWNRRDERSHRRYSLESIRAAAATFVAPAPPAPADEAGPTILLGIDGACWSVMKPLLEAGRLPTFARLIQDGAIGYLDNGDDSLSPSIWTTVYTGRFPEDHRIEHYQKIVLPLSGASLPQRLLSKPSIETFYGVRYLFHYLSPLGLWSIDWVGSHDRRVPACWNILSHFGKRVVVANAIAGLPVEAVNGAMILLDRAPDLVSRTVYPPELAEAWRPLIPADKSGRSEESFAEMARSLDQEAGFFIDLVRVYDADVAIYYTHFLDSVSHTNWDFYDRDSFFLTWAPRNLTNDAWEEFVGEHIDDRVFRAYERADAAVARFLSAFPNATLIIASDHGWTYSGYEHFGSQEGILILAGPGVRGGTTLEDAAIEDLTPTLLALQGVPLSRELPGGVLGQVLDIVTEPVYLTAYDLSKEAGPERETAEVDVEPAEVERLRALGYIQ